jgi:hypothetical protein
MADTPRVTRVTVDFPKPRHTEASVGDSHPIRLYKLSQYGCLNATAFWISTRLSPKANTLDIKAMIVFKGQLQAHLEAHGRVSHPRTKTAYPRLSRHI